MSELDTDGLRVRPPDPSTNNSHPPEAAPDDAEGVRTDMDLGLRFSLFATRGGPGVRSPEQMLRSAVRLGTVAGKTPNGQPEDPGVKVAQATAIGKMRAAARASEHIARCVAPAADHARASDAARLAEEELPQLADRIAAKEQKVEAVAAEVFALEGEQTYPEPLERPSEEERAQMAQDAVPGYRLPRGIKTAFYVGAGLVEAAFAAGYISDVASIGIEGVPVEVSLAVPLALGGATGALIPLAAERAAHAAATARADAPWYVRHATEFAIAVPTLMGLGRAAVMAGGDPEAGVLGVAIALLLTALSIIAAAIGYRESEGAKHDAMRAARADERERDVERRTPGPLPKARQLRDKRAELEAGIASLRTLRASRDAVLAEKAKRGGDRAEAGALLSAAEAQSDLDAEAEGALALATVGAFVERRNAVTATRLPHLPRTYDASRWEIDTSDFPRFRRGDVSTGEPAEGERNESDDDERGTR